MNYIPSKSDLEANLIIKLPESNSSTSLPEITVITVSYNPIKDGREQTLLNNLNSIQSQRGVILEHLIIDGASTDGTLEFLKQYHNTTHEIRILSKPDSGIYEAMNRGIAVARGRYVIFLNTDDFYHNPDGLSASLRALGQTGCAFTFSPIQIFGLKGRHSPHRNPHRRLHKYFLFCTIAHPSMLYRRETLIAVGGYNQQYKLSADYDLNLRIIAAGNKGCYVDTEFVTFMMGGVSTQQRSQGIEEKIKIVRDFHRNQYHADISDEESAWMVKHEYYPAKYLWIYKKSQEQIFRTFVNLPNGLTDKIVRKFNYIKYYILSSMSTT